VNSEYHVFRLQSANKGEHVIKFLAFSDIHNNISCVRALRSQESNEYDAVIVAGDIGNEIAEEFFRVVSTFQCPVHYVFGNWDSDLEYGQSFGALCHHLHQNLVTLDGFCFTGFSGCDTNWGKNTVALNDQTVIAEERDKVLCALRGEMSDKAEPDTNLAELTRQYQRAKQRYARKTKKARDEVGLRNRTVLFELIRSEHIEPSRLILVTHDRQYRLHEDLPGLRLHLFGHRHGFKDTEYKGTRYVNVSALDQSGAVGPRNLAALGSQIDNEKHDEYGTYTVIEVFGSERTDVQCKPLCRKM